MTMTAEASAVAMPHPLVERLFATHGYANVDPAGLDAFAGAPGDAVLFFTEDPVQFRETLDLAVILPEIVGALGRPIRVGVLLPAAARAVAPRYGFRRWPALVWLRDGGYVGAIDGLRDWSDYLAECAQLLDAPVARPPAIGVAVRAAGTAPSSR
jgi:hydrogenase-1 operon protein HyaE